jgi:hypothetical protein
MEGAPTVAENESAAGLTTSDEAEPTLRVTMTDLGLFVALAEVMVTVPVYVPDFVSCAGFTKTLTDTGVVACHEPEAVGVVPMTASQFPTWLVAETIKVIGVPLLFTSIVCGIAPESPT